MGATKTCTTVRVLVRSVHNIYSPRGAGALVGRCHALHVRDEPVRREARHAHRVHEIIVRTRSVAAAAAVADGGAARGCMGAWVHGAVGASVWGRGVVVTSVRGRGGTWVCAITDHEAICCGLNCCTVSTEVSGESMNSDSICSVALKAEAVRIYV